MKRDEQLGTMLRELPVPETPPDFYDQLMAMLEEEDAKRRTTILKLQPRRWRVPNLRRFPAFVAAAAAIALVAAAIGVAVSLVRDGNEIPEVVESPTESGAELLDFSTIAGTWQGELNGDITGPPGDWIQVTIEPTVSLHGVVATHVYRLSPDGPDLCTGRWTALRAEEPEYEVTERSDDFEACASGTVTLVHDPATDTLTYRFTRAGTTPPSTLERVDEPSDVLDFSAIAGTWAGAVSTGPGNQEYMAVTIETTSAAVGVVGQASYRLTSDGPTVCTAQWVALEASAPDYRIMERGDEDLCDRTCSCSVNGRVVLRHDTTTDTLAYEMPGSNTASGTLERADGTETAPDGATAPVLQNVQWGVSP